MGRMSHENNEQMSVPTTSPESVWVGGGSDWAEFRSDHSGHGQVQHLLIKLLTAHPPTATLLWLRNKSLLSPFFLHHATSLSVVLRQNPLGALDGGERVRVGGGFRHCHLV